MKVFDDEIKKMHSRLKEGKPFSFGKFCDGEWMAMRGVPVNNGEFQSNANTDSVSKMLIDAFKYKHDDYYVGVSCPCCQGDDHQRMVDFSEQDQEHLTFANIFVNSNYDYFVNNVIPSFNDFKVHLIANGNSRLDKLPFTVEEFYPVGFSAAENNIDLVDQIINKNLEGKLFLFCCGPFGNILAHKLWVSNKKNIYLDIGSTLNPFLESEGFRRSYFDRDSECGKKFCVWGESL